MRVQGIFPSGEVRRHPDAGIPHHCLHCTFRRKAIQIARDIAPAGSGQLVCCLKVPSRGSGHVNSERHSKALWWNLAVHSSEFRPAEHS